MVKEIILNKALLLFMTSGLVYIAKLRYSPLMKIKRMTNSQIPWMMND